MGMDRQKSLRQLARELGVSHSYLSQVRHGKKDGNRRVVTALVTNGKAAAGLQLRWGALVASSVGSTPIRSRQIQAQGKIL